MNPSSYKVKQVIVVRNDLNMRKGKIAAQVAHASLNAILRTKQFIENSNHQYQMNIALTTDEVFWIMGDYAKIVLQCNSLEDINKIEKECNDKNVPCCKIVDNGTTEFHGDKTVTCISVGPCRSEEIDKITGCYKLL